jgi:hypothetical protein
MSASGAERMAVDKVEWDLGVCESCCNYDCERAHGSMNGTVQIHCRARAVRENGKAQTSVVQSPEDCCDYNKDLSVRVRFLAS